MVEQPVSSWPSAALAPGAACAIPEEEWFHFLELEEPAHQWGSIFLHGEEGGGLRVYLRDDSETKAHGCLRLDGASSAQVREQVEEIESLSRAVADLLAEHQGRPSLSPQDLADEQAASHRFTERAGEVYAELARRVLSGF